MFTKINLTRLKETFSSLKSTLKIKGLQTDVVILDFNKAFDTVPHDKLLHKLETYGVRGALLRWIESFLCNRHMKVLVEGEASSETTVDSGVPKGTGLGPHLFLVLINDLPDSVKSSVKLFAYDCLLFRIIRTIHDHLTLQEDLIQLEKLATD